MEGTVRENSPLPFVKQGFDLILAGNEEKIYKFSELFQAIGFFFLILPEIIILG